MKRVAAAIGSIVVLTVSSIAIQARAARRVDTAVLVSANAEWSVVRALHPRAACETSPFGEFFFEDVVLPDQTSRRVVVFHGGWGKSAAAASTQYVIDCFDPPLLVNLGTCGGFQGAVERFAVVLAARTVIYDVIERMGDAEGAIRDYATDIDLGWLSGKDPQGILRTTLVSADQDLDPAAIPVLRKKYGAVAADWESGAIAWTARRNGKRLLILRGVTDLVGPAGGEAYGKIEVFRKNTETVMKRLFADLPAWLARAPR
jgi:adenosylhomocysteine nucleosidase